MSYHSSISTPPRVILIHDYLTQYGGAEKVLEALYHLWPQAIVYTTFYDRRQLAGAGFSIPASAIRPMLSLRLRGTGMVAKAWTPILPTVFRHLRLPPSDLVISSTSFAAHQVQVRTAVHLAYVHSPPRFLYGLTTELDHVRLRTAIPALRVLYPALRRADRKAVRAVDELIANSQEVRRRIARFYGRDAQVIYPPVQVTAFAGAGHADWPPIGAGDYFLTWGRLVRSKRVDLLVQAVERAGVPLVVAGDGPALPSLRTLAGPRTVFAGRVDHPSLVRLLGGCRAVLFAAEEDFGIVPVEAMAAGKPVLAFGRAGALESVVPGLTGDFFEAQNVDAVAQALARFDPSLYRPEDCRTRAATFSPEAFAASMTGLATRALAMHRGAKRVVP